MAVPLAEVVTYYAKVGGEVRIKIPVDDAGKPRGRAQVRITEPGFAQVVFAVEDDATCLVPPARVARFLACVAGSSPA
jgi:hypothetical protein